MGNGQVCYGNIVQRLNELNVEVGGRWSGQLSSAISLFSMSTAINCCCQRTSLWPVTATSLQWAVGSKPL